MKSFAKWYCRDQSLGERGFIRKFLELYRDSGLKMSEVPDVQRYNWEQEALACAIKLEPLIDSIEYKDDYSLFVRLESGTSKTISLRPFIDFATSPLADPEYFRQAEILENRAGIAWPNGYIIYNFLLNTYDSQWFCENED